MENQPKTRVTVTIDPAVLEAVEKMAREQDRSVSYIINKLCKEATKETV